MDEAKITDFDNGLRILARMVARAYLKDFRQEASRQTSIVEQKEQTRGNQGSSRGGEVARVGKIKLGIKTETSKI